MTNTTKTLLCCLVGLTTMAILVSCGKDDGSSPAPVASTPITVTADWNRVALQAWTQLEATAGAQITPHYEARGLAMSSGVIHDVLNAIDHRYAAYAYVATQPGASPDAAVAQAAHDVMVANTQLVSDYPSGSQKAFLDAALATDLAKVPDGPAKTSGIALGQAAAAYYIQLRAADAPHMAPLGPNPRGPAQQPGDYQYTAPFNSPGAPFNGGSIAVPDWQNIAPFVVRSTTQFAPPGPNAVTSAAFMADLAEVKALGAATGSTRTADQTQIGTFWLENPPLQWNRIARTVAAPKNMNGWDAARMYALLNLSMADGYIVYAQVGNTFNFWRPVTAIHYYDPTSTWQEAAFPTPPTRDYTSGHAMEVGIAATVLANVFGSDSASFAATSTTLPNVTRNYTSFSAAAMECGVSRIYVGYHFRKSTMDGIALGNAIGGYAATSALAAAR
jgi:membrane-associated phospholipid phosphatase